MMKLLKLNQPKSLSQCSWQTIHNKICVLCILAVNYVCYLFYSSPSESYASPTTHSKSKLIHSSLSLSVSLFIYMYNYIYIYIHTYVCVCVCVCVRVYIYKYNTVYRDLTQLLYFDLFFMNIYLWVLFQIFLDKGELNKMSFSLCLCNNQLLL